MEHVLARVFSVVHYLRRTVYFSRSIIQHSSQVCSAFLLQLSWLLFRFGGPILCFLLSGVLLLSHYSLQPAHYWSSVPPPQQLLACGPATLMLQAVTQRQSCWFCHASSSQLL